MLSVIILIILIIILIIGLALLIHGWRRLAHHGYGTRPTDRHEFKIFAAGILLVTLSLGVALSGF